MKLTYCPAAPKSLMNSNFCNLKSSASWLPSDTGQCAKFAYVLTVLPFTSPAIPTQPTFGQFGDPSLYSYYINGFASNEINLQQGIIGHIPRSFWISARHTSLKALFQCLILFLDSASSESILHLSHRHLQSVPQLLPRPLSQERCHCLNYLASLHNMLPIRPMPVQHLQGATTDSK